MEEKFKIKSYGYCELAQLYFPNISKKSASVQIRNWIQRNEKLKNELHNAGFMPGKKILTPRQVTLIINEIGEP